MILLNTETDTGLVEEYGHPVEKTEQTGFIFMK